jgi:endogenous inhibitor of DNA gyrase (YacG/DUF329 family)
MVTLSIISFAVLALVVLVDVAIGLYVYKDAKSRKMDAALWALVAVLVPSFIGLIIYLVIRTNNPTRPCPRCQRPVAANYVLCPYCGATLKAECPACGTPVENSWKLCPQCGKDLPEQTDATAAAGDAFGSPPKDRKLVLVIIAAIVAPILVVGIIVLGLIPTFNGGNSSTAIGFHIEENEETPAAVRSWMEECDAAGEGVYALKLSSESSKELMPNSSGDGQLPFFGVYVYINRYKGSDEGKAYAGTSVFEQGTWVISYVTSQREEQPDYELSTVSSTGLDVKRLRIIVDVIEEGYSLTEL